MVDQQAGFQTMNDVASGLTVASCTQCGALYFPRRLICRKCGGAAFGDYLLREGVVEESTTISHVTRQENWKPCHLATVGTPEGLHVIAGVEAPFAEGARVKLEERQGAPFASPV